MLRSENRLGPQQQLIPPGTEVLPILRKQCLRTIAVEEIALKVTLAIGFPLVVRRWQTADSQTSAYPMKHVIELPLLVRSQGPGEKLVGPLGVVDEHVEHVAVGPIGNGLP